MLGALILAAGDSSRMGSAKAVLPDRAGVPFVVRLVRTFHAAGILRVVIVTGAAHAQIAEVVGAAAAVPAPQIVRNPDPTRGALSSLWAALDAIPPGELHALLMTPVDMPLVRAGTVAAVVDGWRRTGAPVVRPVVADRHGHPVLFDRAVFGELRRAPLSEGARAVVRAHADDLVNVEVKDEGCVEDIDTPEDYRRLIEA